MISKEVSERSAAPPVRRSYERYIGVIFDEYHIECDTYIMMETYMNFDGGFGGHGQEIDRDHYNEMLNHFDTGYCIDYDEDWIPCESFRVKLDDIIELDPNSVRLIFDYGDSSLILSNFTPGLIENRGNWKNKHWEQGGYLFVKV